jgi:hypothetical protein
MAERDVATAIVRDVRNMLLEERLPAGSHGILNRIDRFFNTPWEG